MTALFLHPSTRDWQGLGGGCTAQEIDQQPRLWRALGQQLAQQGPAIQAFIGDWMQRADHLLILTGAGSSAFVGEIVADELAIGRPAQVRAVATTSLLTHSHLYLTREVPTLLVSFARSGNSPESLAAVDLLRKKVDRPRFLNITCNPDGHLARQAEGHADSFTLLMPEGSCDRGFAMTSSFSCMLIAALAVLGGAADAVQRIAHLADLGERALSEWAAPIAALAAEPFGRIVYLGSGPLEALAKEAALKVLELSAGRTLAMANTALGFRHGPKSVLNHQSLVIFLRSSNPLAQRYEQDLLDELERDQVAGRWLSIGPASAGCELSCAPAAELDDSWLAPVWLIAAQLFSLNKSASLGLTPDNPFPDGTVNRVVQGVIIHPHA